MAQFPSNAPTLTGTGEAIAPPLPSRNAVAVGVAEFAVLLVRGSAAAVLLSPAVLVALLLAN